MSLAVQVALKYLATWSPLVPHFGSLSINQKRQLGQPLTHSSLFQLLPCTKFSWLTIALLPEAEVVVFRRLFPISRPLRILFIVFYFV